MAFEVQSLGLPAAGDSRAARRDALFRETPKARAIRLALGLAWAVKPRHLNALPALGSMWTRSVVAPARELPDPASGVGVLGLCGIAHDVSPETLAAAYRRGLCAFAHVGPLKWMCVPEHCVLSFGEFHMTRRLRSKLRQGRHHVTFDRDFDAVIAACAEPRPGRLPLTWITPKIMRAFSALHDAGYAHSVEVYNHEGALVGGTYGVAVGGAFIIESQFSRESGASKIGFCVLAWHLARWGFVLADNKAPTRNVLEMGFKTVPRNDFLARLAASQSMPDRGGRWQTETNLATVAAWQPDAMPSSAH